MIMGVSRAGAGETAMVHGCPTSTSLRRSGVG